MYKAEASEEIFQAYLKHGNHSPMRDNQDLFEQTIVKQNKCGFTIIMDPKFNSLGAQRATPQGLVTFSTHDENLDHYLTAVSYPTCICNQQNSKVHEPKLHIHIIQATMTSSVHSDEKNIIQTLLQCSVRYTRIH